MLLLPMLKYNRNMIHLDTTKYKLLSNRSCFLNNFSSSVMGIRLDEICEQYPSVKILITKVRTVILALKWCQYVNISVKHK